MDWFIKFDDGCGRFGLYSDDLDLVHHYGLHQHVPGFEKSYNISPGQFTPAVVANDEGKPELRLMKWGVVPSWSKDPKIGYKLFNARDDNIFKSPIWRGIILRRRALIPANGFFEWTKPEKGSKEPKRKYYFHPKQQSLFSFAGVYDTWKDVEGKEWESFSLITTEPNKELRPFHNRMPVILSKEDENSWIDPALQSRMEVEKYLKPLADDILEANEVSNNTRGFEPGDPALITPLPK